ncbi:MAG: AMP-binding protein [Verrucomicrobiae bacterium]|nr:AMP-binding protein [Verrucomicrobiae bacterium]
MESADLSHAAYWRSQETDLRFNPVDSPIRQGLIDFIRREPAVAGHVLVATSGSTGAPKFVALSRRALLASAAMVNRHLGASAADRWLCALPTFHVGGIGVHARAHLTGSPVLNFSGRGWKGRAREFAGRCQEEAITLTSLTPTQVFDLVVEGIPAPDSLRAVIVGGGRLDPDLRTRARTLGWPVLASYGMTEAASQIATEGIGQEGDGEWLPVLSGWEVSVSEDDGRLRIRGEALFSGTVEKTEGKGWEFREAPRDERGWFETRDRATLSADGRKLKFEGRCDDFIKRLGELISMEAVRRRFNEVAASFGLCGTVAAVPDERAGYRLVAYFERVAEGEGRIPPCLDAFHAGVAPFSRIDEIRVVDALPRTALGKVAWARLAEL